MDPLYLFTMVMAPVAFLGVGAIALLVKLDHDVDAEIRADDAADDWISLV